MIGKSTLKKYEFNDMGEYFSYIVDSQINGNHSQVRELYNKLNGEQQKEFFNWLKLNQVKFDFTGTIK